MCSEIEELFERAKQGDVGVILANGVNMESNKKTLDFTSNPVVKAALGLYPIDALDLTDSQIEDSINFIRKNANRISAIGEVGLDFKEDLNNWDRQKFVFKKVIDLSIEIDKPLIVHSRKAEKETIEFLELNGAKKVIMHCFNGKISLLARIVKNEWYLTIPTNVTHSEHFQMVIGKIGIHKLIRFAHSPN